MDPRRIDPRTKKMKIISEHDLGNISCCLVMYVGDPTTFWVSLDKYSEAAKVMLRELNTYMGSRQHLCLPAMDSVRTGRFVIVRFPMKGWLRGEVTAVNGTTCTIFLGDYGVAMDCPVAELRSLPPRFHALPWQTVRIRLRGVKLRSRQPLQRTTQITEVVMTRRKGLLANVQSTPDGLTATLTLDRILDSHRLMSSSTGCRSATWCPATTRTLTLRNT